MGLIFSALTGCNQSYSQVQRLSPTDCFDATIVGAGSGSLSTALILGRPRRCVLIIDSGRLNLLSY